MSRVYTAMIVRYADQRGRAGSLLGLVTFSDGKSLKVWRSAPELHQQCQQLPQGTDVRYTFKHSDKWGDALDTISPTKAEHEQYDDLRLQDEQRGHVKPTSYIGQRIAKGNQAVTPLTQTQALPPDQVSDDHESLMRRSG